MLLQQSIEHVFIMYTHVTPICNALIHVIYSVVSGQYSYTITSMGEVFYNHTKNKHFEGTCIL